MIRYLCIFISVLFVSAQYLSFTEYSPSSISTDDHVSLCSEYPSTTGVVNTCVPSDGLCSPVEKGDFTFYYIAASTFNDGDESYTLTEYLDKDCAVEVSTTVILGQTCAPVNVTAGGTIITEYYTVSEVPVCPSFATRQSYSPRETVFLKV
jgi:hypothetical protein